MTSVPRVLWLGLLEGPSGYADETRGFLRALERSGAAPAARALLKGGDAPLGADDRAMLKTQTSRDGDDPDVVVHHYAPAWARDTPIVPGAPNVARTMFETDSVPHAWLAQLLSRDEVWVPSQAGAEAFERGGVPASRLRVVGGTLDFDLYRPDIEPYPIGVEDGHLVFLSNFDFSERKAWRQLLAAWARAFAPTDPVTLVLKTGSGQPGVARARVREEALAAARRAGRTATAPVKVMTETLSTTDLARLYAASDAFVLPSRGEGWGRPYMEAMAMGLPTVASRFLGNTEFMDDATSWLIDGELVPVPSDHGVFADDVEGHRWFEPDGDQLVEVLQEIAGDPAAANARAAGARDDLIARFGPDATAQTLQQAIAEVADKYAGHTRSTVMRGPFGRNASLALVNDLLLENLETQGRRVVARPHHAPALAEDHTSVSHSWPPDFSAGALGRSVMILPWEYGSPPLEWAQRIAGEIDRVVVYSDYIREGYVEAGLPPGAIEVVPCGVDLDLFTPEGPARDLGRTAGTVFLFNGGTIWRKGVDLLLEGWAKAFGPDDDVLLVIKDFGVNSHYLGRTHTQLIEETMARADVAPIHYFTDHLAPEELPALYRAADVLVAPYRGEGFCLPVLEAMACGIPAIHTAIGPSNEFCGPESGWAVAAERMGLRHMKTPPTAADPYVHDVDTDALAEALRAATDPEERRRRGAGAHRQAQGHGWDAAARRLDEVLTALEAEGLPPVRDVVPERPESRGTLVAYAPDWDAGEWVGALTRWANEVDADADVTLALLVDEARAQDVAEQVMGVLDELGDDLPDLALHSRPDSDPLPLVLGADAVLLDDAQAPAPPPALHRRATKLLTLDALPGAFKRSDPAPIT